MAMELLIELHFTLLLFNVWVNSSPYSMAGIATKFTIIYKFLDFFIFNDSVGSATCNNALGVQFLRSIQLA